MPSFNDPEDIIDSHKHSVIHEHQNVNVRAALIHVIGDIIQSIGVIIAALIIYFKPEWWLADPICTFFFSVLVIFTTVPVVKDCIKVLMEGAPEEVNLEEL